jgi:hypothetical protein
MLFDDTYKTIENPAEGIFRDRGSKFLAYAYPINSENDIKAIVAGLKSEHPKANHHCWAMRLTIDRSVFRVNDDGEPSGTAGRPILNTLLSKHMQSFEIDKTDLLRIKTALEADDAELEKVLKEYHASEIAILFEKLPQEAKKGSSIFCLLMLHPKLSPKWTRRIAPVSCFKPASRKTFGDS